MVSNDLVHHRKRRALQRGISLLLLVLCFFDLAIADVFFPGSCERESEILPLVTAASTTANLELSNLLITDFQQENRQAPAKSSPGEEDCFCCCTHIVSVAFYKFARPLLQTEPIASYPLSIPTAPHIKLFHPPRLA
jgi:hypothetical protein